MPEPYYVYMILCENGGVYTGYTTDLDCRMELHKRGKAARYTRMHKPKKLVHVEKFCSKIEAINREIAIKKLTHRKKIELMNSCTYDFLEFK